MSRRPCFTHHLTGNHTVDSNSNVRHFTKSQQLAICNALQIRPLCFLGTTGLVLSEGQSLSWFHSTFLQSLTALCTAKWGCRHCTARWWPQGMTERHWLTYVTRCQRTDEGRLPWARGSIPDPTRARLRTEVLLSNSNPNRYPQETAVITHEVEIAIQLITLFISFWKKCGLKKKTYTVVKLSF